ncbi:hypothetical protein KY284_035838 [Solanum tuberosum]|nr:hypothetical protein KY284_035838 [Solanum tuberosum]
MNLQDSTFSFNAGILRLQYGLDKGACPSPANRCDLTSKPHHANIQASVVGPYPIIVVGNSDAGEVYLLLGDSRGHITDTGCLRPLISGAHNQGGLDYAIEGIGNMIWTQSVLQTQLFGLQGNTDSSGQQGETRKEMEMERESATNMLRKSNEDPEMISKLSLNLRSKKGSTLPTFALKVQKETKGSNNASFRRHCEAMVKMHKPVMLVLLETRMGEHKRLIEVLNFESLILPAAVGLCRGIVIMWKKDILKLNDISITMLSIHVMFQVTTDDTNPWLFYAIYASNDFAIRNNLWKELTDLSKNTSSEWLSRGIRQGHHMSPYLFIICMERLSRDINRKVDNKSWYPIKTTNSGPKISHLFFVVDPTLFARANILNCNAIT